MTDEEHQYYRNELRQFHHLVQMHPDSFWANYLAHAAQMIERLLPSAIPAPAVSPAPAIRPAPRRRLIEPPRKTGLIR